MASYSQRLDKRFFISLPLVTRMLGEGRVAEAFAALEDPRRPNARHHQG